ncbi:MAG: HlyC/CorC family transporter, partial [Chloroflexi bacterium]|nr:HlyC/CorC family transporter [Chloroflexota bacterium]
GWIGEPAVADLIRPLFLAIPGPWGEVTTHGVATAVAFALITFLHVVLGELAPKSIALQHPDRTSLWVARPTLWFENLFRPAIWLLNGTGNLLVRSLGLRPPREYERVHSVAELRMLISESEKAGVLEQVERELVHRVFEFSDREVREVMIPRPDIVGIEADAPLEDLLKIFAETSHARFPVYRENLDQIAGIVAMKEVLRTLATDPQARRKPVGSLVRPALFVPETKRIGELLQEMRQARVQMSIVIDEFGGTAGLVTLEELLEEIVGRVSDELVKVTPTIQPIDERTVQVDALMRIDEANTELQLGLPEKEEYETIAGFILYTLRRIPREGEQFSYDKLRITVAEMKGPKIEKVLITRS